MTFSYHRQYEHHKSRVNAELQQILEFYACRHEIAPTQSDKRKLRAYVGQCIRALRWHKKRMKLHKDLIDRTYKELTT